jgi:hypothetical protein
MFAPDAPFPTRLMVKMSTVFFNIQTCEIDPTTSAPKIAKETELWEGTIADSTMTLSPDDLGLMKDVYKVCTLPLSISNILIHPPLDEVGRKIMGRKESSETGIGFKNRGL